MDALIKEVLELDLPADQYLVTASGPLAVRGLRDAGDVDLVVTSELWCDLCEKYGVQTHEGLSRIVISPDRIEVLGDGSIYWNALPDAPAFKERLAARDVVGGVPFESLENVKFFKSRLGREKDNADIEAIERWERSYT